MTVGVLHPQGSDGRAADFATHVESLGYDSLWAGELWGDDALVALADAAAHTDDLLLGTAIVNVFSRSPSVLAMASATLADLSGGRFRLGVGPSTPTAVEAIHGLTYDRPLRHVREAVELVTLLTSGSDDRVVYDGERYQVAGVSPIDGDVPVYNAALGPANRRLTGRFCDGWIPHNVPFRRLDEAFETLADEAREAGRDPDDVAVAPYVPAAVAADPADARAAIRGHVAYYVGSGEGYRRAVAAQFPTEADRVAELWQAGDRDDARAAVTEEMVAALGVAGRPEEAREAFREVAELDVVDEPIVVVPAGADEEMVERTVEALAPAER